MKDYLKLPVVPDRIRQIAKKESLCGFTLSDGVRQGKQDAYIVNLKYGDETGYGVLLFPNGTAEFYGKHIYKNANQEPVFVVRTGFKKYHVVPRSTFQKHWVNYKIIYDAEDLWEDE